MSCENDKNKKIIIKTQRYDGVDKSLNDNEYLHSSPVAVSEVTKLMYRVGTHVYIGVREHLNVGDIIQVGSFDIKYRVMWFKQKTEKDGNIYRIKRVDDNSITKLDMDGVKLCDRVSITRGAISKSAMTCVEEEVSIERCPPKPTVPCFEVPVPVVVYIKNTDETFKEEVECGGTIEIPDATVNFFDSIGTGLYTKVFPSGVETNFILQDTLVRLYNTASTELFSSLVPSITGGIIVAPDARVKNTSGSYDVLTPSGVVTTVPDSVITYPNGSTFNLPATEPLTFTGNSVVSNSDDSFLVNVPCGSNLELEDIQYNIYVNGNLDQSFTVPASVDLNINISA